MSLLRFYNTTYTVFAASIILVYVTQEASEGETAPLLKLVGMAVEILETMDECVVAAKAAQMLRRAAERAERKSSATAAAAQAAAPVPPAHASPAAAGSVHAAPAQRSEAMLQLNQYWGPLSFVGGEMDLDFGFPFAADLDGAGAALMALAEQSEMQG
jgi:hypothetical protein